MVERRSWTYYRYGFPGDDVVVYFRRREGVTHGLRQSKPLVWVSQNDDYLSHFIENGETGLDETTVTTIESELGKPLPI